MQQQSHTHPLQPFAANHDIRRPAVLLLAVPVTGIDLVGNVLAQGPGGGRMMCACGWG